MVVCPNCGFQGALNTPFLYHDAENELALVYVPMELGATDIERQKAIGDLTNRLMQRLPPEDRKGYLLQPRTFLSVQNLVDAMLEQDEETRELVEAQQRRVELIERLRQLDPEDTLAMAEFLGANDDEIDESFFQLLDILISMAESQGNTIEHERLVKHRDSLLEKSSAGKLIHAQLTALEALSSTPTRETLIDQLIGAENREVREALVAVGRGLLDYAFFQALTARIDEAQTAGDQAKQNQLMALRKEIQEIRDQVDARAVALLDARARLLRDVLVAENPREMIQRHLLEIDDAFLGVLSSNIQQAASEGRQDIVEQLREIGNLAIEVLNQNAPPEIRLLNQLVSAADDQEMHRLLEQGQSLLDEDFLELLESTAQDLEQSSREEGARRLRSAMKQVKEMVST
jgi:hypothetical protein